MSYVSAFGVLVKTPNFKQLRRPGRKRWSLATFQLGGHTFEVQSPGAIAHACDPSLKCRVTVVLTVSERKTERVERRLRP